MKMPRIGSKTLTSAVLAGVVALSAVLGPAMLPTSLGGSTARAELTVSIGLFQEELAPYGRWDDDPRYGEVWYPDVREGWRPYYDDGHWVYSDDYGWLWVADQPWGWAPFHYGRWVLTDYGWAWVPGTVWGPAWVTFRSAPDYIGWAPLPPEADWDYDYGFRRSYDVDDDRYWTFVRPRGFLERRFQRYAYDRHDNRRFIQNTTNITNITIVNNHIVNRGIDVNHVERVTHRRVERVRVADSDRPQRTQLQGNKVLLYKPRVVDQGGDSQQILKKRRNQQQFGQPEEQMQPSAGGNDQPQILKKKRRNQQQFGQPEEQMQPSFGGNDQPQILKKRRNQQQFDQPSFGGNDQPQILKKRRNQQQFGGDQPQLQRQQKRAKQCQNGDPNACGN